MFQTKLCILLIHLGISPLVKQMQESEWVFSSISSCKDLFLLCVWRFSYFCLGFLVLFLCNEGSSESTWYWKGKWASFLCLIFKNDFILLCEVIDCIWPLMFTYQMTFFLKCSPHSQFNLSPTIVKFAQVHLVPTI